MPEGVTPLVLVPVDVVVEGVVDGAVFPEALPELDVPFPVAVGEDACVVPAPVVVVDPVGDVVVIFVFVPFVTGSHGRVLVGFCGLVLCGTGVAV